MFLLDLNKLQPGDVILEEGDPRVAKLTGGPFGHASITISRLIFVEADNGVGVEAVGFKPKVWTSQGRSIYAHAMADANAAPIVRRLVAPPEPTAIQAIALWELGRGYARSAAAKFPDMRASVRRALAREASCPKIPGPPDAAGRACSEVVAEILRSKPTAVSPNGLVARTGFIDVPDAVHDNRHGIWKLERDEIARSEIDAAIAEITRGLAQEAHEKAQQVWRLSQQPGGEALKDAAVKAAAAGLEVRLTEEIENLLRALSKLDKQAADMFITEV